MNKVIKSDLATKMNSIIGIEHSILTFWSAKNFHNQRTTILLLVAMRTSTRSEHSYDAGGIIFKPRQQQRIESLVVVDCSSERPDVDRIPSQDQHK